MRNYWPKLGPTTNIEIEAAKKEKLVDGIRQMLTDYDRLGKNYSQKFTNS